MVGYSTTSGGSRRPSPGPPSGGMVDLGTLPRYSESRGLGVNNQGEVVGFSFNPNGESRQAFTWTTSGGMVDLGALLGGVLQRGHRSPRPGRGGRLRRHRGLERPSPGLLREGRSTSSPAMPLA